MNEWSCFPALVRNAYGNVAHASSKPTSSRGSGPAA
jgi:hypothetical protein